MSKNESRIESQIESRAELEPPSGPVYERHHGITEVDGERGLVAFGSNKPGVIIPIERLTDGEEVWRIKKELIPEGTKIGYPVTDVYIDTPEGIFHIKKELTPGKTRVTVEDWVGTQEELSQNQTQNLEIGKPLHIGNFSTYYPVTEVLVVSSERENPSIIRGATQKNGDEITDTDRMLGLPDHRIHRKSRLPSEFERQKQDY